MPKDSPLDGSSDSSYRQGPEHSPRNTLPQTQHKTDDRKMVQCERLRTSLLPVSIPKVEAHSAHDASAGCAGHLPAAARRPRLGLRREAGAALGLVALCLRPSAVRAVHAGADGATAGEVGPKVRKSAEKDRTRQPFCYQRKALRVSEGIGPTRVAYPSNTSKFGQCSRCSQILSVVLGK